MGMPILVFGIEREGFACKGKVLVMQLDGFHKLSHLPSWRVQVVIQVLVVG